MPVGSAEKGVGLWAGQVMFTANNVNQYIDWWHEALPGSGESFEHEGTLSTILITPGITIGLSNYWNLSINQIVGTRIMKWEGDTTTIHHRNEASHSSFINAIGGIFGDRKILLKYLLYNDGQGAGKRIFIGTGLTIPSRNTITSDPFFLRGEEKVEHRHFAMSEGSYKALFECQYYIKRHSNPVFVGGSATIEAPLHTNQHGYKASNLYDISLSALTKEISQIGTAISLGLNLRHSTKAYWNNIASPNSVSTILTPSVGTIFNLSSGGINLSIQRTFFLNGKFSGIEGDVNQKVSSYQINLGYRHTLDYVIPWLDPLKNL